MGGEKMTHCYSTRGYHFLVYRALLSQKKAAAAYRLISCPSYRCMRQCQRLSNLVLGKWRKTEGRKQEYIAKPVPQKAGSQTGPEGMAERIVVPSIDSNFALNTVLKIQETIYRKRAWIPKCGHFQTVRQMCFSRGPWLFCTKNTK